jgi:nucleoside-diphosphate-sugar epimerase
VRCLVTGAAGFIGARLTRLLLERGHDVVAFVRPTTDLRRLAPLSAGQDGARLRLALGDLADRASLDRAVVGVDVVFHLAASLMAFDEAGFRGPIVDGTRRVLEACAERAGGPPRRILHVSSQAAGGPSADGSALDEDAPARPISWYGTAKKDAEAVVAEFAARGLAITVVRPVAVYGEGEVYLASVFAAAEKGLLPRLGAADQRASFVEVDDLVRGMLAAVESDATAGRTYTLANPEPVLADAFPEAALAAAGKTARFKLSVPLFLLQIAAGAERLRHVLTRLPPMLTRDKVREVTAPHWASTPARAEREFGWRAQTTLADGVARTFAAWKARRAYLRDVTAEPVWDRAVRTYALAVLAGVLLEGYCHVADWYRFHPGWFLFVAVATYFGGVLGSIAFFTAKKGTGLRFLLGALSFAVVETLNEQVWHLWTFQPEPLGGWNPWVRLLALAVPVGLVPVAIHEGVVLLRKRRLRIG